MLRGGHRITLAARPEEIWDSLRRIGGANGWYFAQPLWRLRGFIDRLLGGPGLRRGRRDPVNLRVGDALDFWRVVTIEPNERLVLLAEMKAPGDALLEFILQPAGEEITVLEMVARFLPRGLAGIVYWYLMLPAHDWLFKGMLRKVGQKTDKHVLAEPYKITVEDRLTCRL